MTVVGAITCVLCSSPVAAQSYPAGTKTALLVVGSTALGAGDAALKQRLETYYPTTVGDDAGVADLSKDVVVISGSVAASTLGTKYKATAKGVVVLAPAVLPAMAMAGATGTLSGQTQLQILGTGSMLAAGLPANAAATVYRGDGRVGWATPASTALKVALAADGNAARAAIFRNLKGATMVGGYVAPGRRVGYYLQSADLLTDDGWRLFDNAVANAAGLTAVPTAVDPPPVDPPPPPVEPPASYVKVPAGSERFLSFPTSDPEVKLAAAWYYDLNTLNDSYCTYPNGDVSGYGRHCAIDYYKGGPTGNVTFPVVAMADGVAFRASSTDGKMTIEHENADPSGRKFCTRFSHLDGNQPVLPVGIKVPVKRGELVAWAGKTQMVRIHLHLVVRVGGCSGQPVDPYDLAAGLLDRNIAPVRTHYPGGANFAGCGPDPLWLSCTR